MSKIRAYKLAEELGIDRNEFVEKARAFGVELKNAMASLDEETAGSLRGKFGGGPSQEVTEKTVEAEGGRKVIRRRRRAKPAPEPEPVAVAPEPSVEDLQAPAAEPEPIAAEADGVDAAAGAEEPEAESEPGAPEEAGAPAPGPGRVCRAPRPPDGRRRAHHALPPRGAANPE